MKLKDLMENPIERERARKSLRFWILERHAEHYTFLDAQATKEAAESRARQAASIAGNGRVFWVVEGIASFSERL